MRTARLTVLLFVLLAGCGAHPGVTATAANLDDASASSEASTDGPAGAPITGLAPVTWTWVPFPSAQCRDGSSTGIGISLNPSSDRLLVFEQGGGACFNPETCAGNPSSFGASDFAALASAHCGEMAGHTCTSINDGIFDRTQGTNPAREWSYVFLPYCTGDVHAGNRRDVTLAGVLDDAGAPQVQQFVGYANVQRYLQRVAPTFPKLSRVLLAGASAGGFGVVSTYSLVARAFASVPVDVIDDSGPPMEDPYLAACQQAEEAVLWGLGGTILADCGADCAGPATDLLDYTQHIVKAYPEAAFGLVSSTDDNTTTNELGFGHDNCTSFQPLSAGQFSAGLADIQSKLAAFRNFGAFLFGGDAHTSLQNGAFYSRVAGGVRDGGTGADGGVTLTDWTGKVAVGDSGECGSVISIRADDQGLLLSEEPTVRSPWTRRAPVSRRGRESP